MLDLSNNLILTTVRIETVTSQGTGSGTGFIFIFAEGIGKECVPAIITNKHVIEGAHTTRFYLPVEFNGQTHHQPIEIKNSEVSWILHPDGLDLAMLPIGRIAGDLFDAGRKVNVTPFRVCDIAGSEYREGMVAIEDVVMIGYPNGLWDQLNNRPIARKGVTATSVNFEFNGKQEFVIDCACWPGSSGSPVIHYSRGTFLEGSEVKAGERYKLLGIMYAGPVYSAQGIVKTNIPSGSLGSVATTGIMMNLGYCIRADQLLAFEKLARDSLAEAARL